MEDRPSAPALPRAVVQCSTAQHSREISWRIDRCKDAYYIHKKSAPFIIPWLLPVACHKTNLNCFPLPSRPKSLWLAERKLEILSVRTIIGSRACHSVAPFPPPRILVSRCCASRGPLTPPAYVYWTVLVLSFFSLSPSFSLSFTRTHACKSPSIAYGARPDGRPVLGRLRKRKEKEEEKNNGKPPPCCRMHT